MISMITKKQHDHNDQQNQKDHNDKHCLRNMMVINITMIIMIHNYQVHNDHHNYYHDQQVHKNHLNHMPKIHHNDHQVHNDYHNQDLNDHQVHNNLHNHVPKIHHNHCDYNVYNNHVLKT